MSRFAEVKVNISVSVFVEVEDSESIEDAIQYATDECLRFPGDITASSEGFIVAASDIDAARRHSDIQLTL